MTEPPDLAVEVVSAESLNRDSRTKRDDYEAAGIREYWLVDPIRNSFRFFVLRERVYVEVEAQADRYQSMVLPGFSLDLAYVREFFD